MKRAPPWGLIEQLKPQPEAMSTPLEEVLVPGLKVHRSPWALKTRLVTQCWNPEVPVFSKSSLNAPVKGPVGLICPNAAPAVPASAPNDQHRLLFIFATPVPPRGTNDHRAAPGCGPRRLRHEAEERASPARRYLRSAWRQGHPAANRWRKQVKSATLSRGGWELPSQLATGSAAANFWRKQVKSATFRTGAWV